MGIHNKRVLGVSITIDSKEYILEETQKYLLQIRNPKHEIRKKDIKPFVIFTPNPEIINYAQKDEKFKEIVNSSQINIPDGIGVVWALKKLYGLNVERLSGADLMLDLCSMAEKEGLTVGLIGGREGIAVAALECLQKKYPNLKGWAREGPLILTVDGGRNVRKMGVTRFGGPPTSAHFDLSRKEHLLGENRGRTRIFRDTQIIIDKIIREKTDILFVALGFPKQEFFIDFINQQLAINNYQSPIVMMAIGGTLDYLAGRSIRAPGWVRNIGLEWLYRLIHEPWRLPRQLEGGKFFLQVLTSK